MCLSSTRGIRDMPLSIPTPLALGRFKRLPQRTGEVWQGDIVRFPMWVSHQTDPDGPPFRPTGVLWTSMRTGLVHLDMASGNESAPADLALATLLEFGLKWAKALEGRPARVEVRDASLRDALAGPLATLDTSVALVDDLPAVREALQNLEAHSTGERLPGLLESPGMSVDRLRAFASAAAAFFVARPWDQLANDDLLIVDGGRTPRDMRHVSVLGQGGQQFGLAFFDSRDAFERLIEGTGAGRSASRAHGVTFGAIDELPFADADAWQDHALPVAGPQAYPLAADLKRGGSMRRPAARQLTFAEGLLRALAETTEDEFDAGTWQKRVQTFDGPIELTLTLPLLLEAEAGRRPRVDSRGPSTIHHQRYVVPYLLDPGSIPFDRPHYFSLQSREEAAYVAETLADAFAETDGAREWLAAQARRRPSRSRRGRRRR